MHFFSPWSPFYYTDWYLDAEKKKYFRIQASHAAAPGDQYSKDVVKRKRRDEEVGYFLDLDRDVPDMLQKKKRRVCLSRRVATEKIKKAPILSHPLIGADMEIGSHLPKNVKREHHGLAYFSQIRGKQLHRFEPWPDEYSIKHVLRHNRSGILIASMPFVSTILISNWFSQVDIVGASRLFRRYRQSASTITPVDHIRVCFPDCDQEKWTYNRTMERFLFKEPYRVCSIYSSERPSTKSYLGIIPVSQPHRIFAVRSIPGLVHIHLTYKTAQQWTVAN